MELDHHQYSERVLITSEQTVETSKMRTKRVARVHFRGLKKSQFPRQRRRLVSLLLLVPSMLSLPVGVVPPFSEDR